MTDIRIRPFRDSDIPFLIEQHTVTYEDEFDFGPGYAASLEREVLDFAKKTRREKEDILIAELDGERVGSVAITATDDPDTCQLRWFLVIPELRRDGVGKLLLSLAMAKALEWGYNRCYLWTASPFSDSRHMYGRFGFRMTETKENREWTDGLILEEKWEAVLRRPESTLIQ